MARPHERPHPGPRTAPRITPNPIAAGFPTDGDPVLIDVSMSTTTNALTRRLFDAGTRLPGPWLILDEFAGGCFSPDGQWLS